MASRKTKVVEFEGIDLGAIGDIQYWDGANWVRLSPSDDGKRLVTHGTSGSPTWEWLICNGAVVWYTPGGSWHIGPYIGKAWYQTTTYLGIDPTQAALDTWVSVAPEYDPVPSTINYNNLISQFTVAGAGIFRANDVYNQKGTNDGVPTFGNAAWIAATPQIDPYRFLDATIDAYADNLVSGWKFEETSGILADSIGSNYGNPTGNPTYQVTGKDGKCLDFDGAFQYVTVPNLDRNNLTISLWIKRDRISVGLSGDRMLMSVNNGGFGFYLETDNKLRFRCSWNFLKDRVLELLLIL